MGSHCCSAELRGKHGMPGILSEDGVPVGSPRLTPPLGSQNRTKKRNVHLYLGHERIV